MTTIPATACQLASIRTEDFPVPPVSLAERARIAAARPDLADDMRVASIRVYGDVPPADYDPDEQGRWIGRAWIEVREHVDPLNPDSVVVRVRECAGDQIAAEVADMGARGTAPAYLTRALLSDLAAQV